MHPLISRLLPIALLATGCPSESHDDGGHGSTDAHGSTAHEHASSTGTTGHDHVTTSETTHASSTTHEHATEASTTHEHATEAGTTHEHATDSASSGGPQDPAVAYCECMVVYCHDDYHGTWGEDHEMSEAMCQAEANGLPSVGKPAMSGNSLECRTYYCDLAMTDPAACASAIGGGSCV